MKKFYKIYFAALVILVSLDQFLKFLVLSTLFPGESVALIPDIFHITLVQNSGGAFGLFKGNTGMLVIVSILVILFIIFFYVKLAPRYGNYLSISLFLILVGTIGNLIDRLRFGYVVDFLDFRVWPVFNLADITITIGGIIAACGIVMPKFIEKIKTKET